MKKLLSMIGAITLIGTASTSVIACGKGEQPTPTSKTELNGLPTNATVRTCLGSF